MQRHSTKWKAAESVVPFTTGRQTITVNKMWSANGSQPKNLTANNGRLVANHPVTGTVGREQPA